VVTDNKHRQINPVQRSLMIPQAPSQAIVTRHHISNKRKQNVRILLAEDNIMNQKVTMRILEVKLGYRADAVANGAEAIEALSRQNYDLVLIDCQMPEMNGYEAARAIRDPNSPVRNHNIPLIAMNANAMKGDREKCLIAGMDDCVAKPIRAQDLADAIERNLPREKQSQFPPTSQAEATEPIDINSTYPEGIRSQYADDSDIADILDKFVATLGGRIMPMRNALANRDYDEVRRLAHKLKGAGGSYGYPQLSETAGVLDNVSAIKDSEMARLALKQLSELCRAVEAGHHDEHTCLTHMS
jgi:two-component system sensor histidine kinase/response regulator